MLDVKEYLKKYSDDLFFGEELKFIEQRLKSMESSIAVVGQFSVGKSALLNALLGEDILATRKIESTKVLTRIRHCASKEDSKIALILKDGDTKTFSLENIGDLQKYTTFQGAEITDSINYVDVYWPVYFLNKELVLVDTPGANSLTTSAFQTTRDQLKTSSAIIYLFLGTKGLDAEDYSIIEEYIAHKKKVFLVGTHIDQLTKSEWQEVKVEVKRNINQFDAIKDIEIVGVSSIEASTAKKTQNQGLLNQSNLPTLEKMLHTYMDTKEYEAAEIRSIENDFLLLLNEIDSFEMQQVEVDKAEEEERQRRLERLTALTELEYIEVEQYGLGLLKQRTNAIELLNDKYENMLFADGNEILKKVRSQYKTFQQYIKQQIPISPNVKQLRSEYVKHLNNVEEIYQDWDKNLESFGQVFADEIECVVQNQDNEFSDMLKKIETNVFITWDDFDLILKNIKLKPLRITGDYREFEIYEEKDSVLKEEQKETKRSIKKNEERIKDLRTSKLKEEKKIRDANRVERNKLGTKPEPRPRYKSKGFWIFKSDEFIGYDYSEQERWDRNMSEIHSSYKKKLSSIEHKYMNLLKDENQEKQNLLKQLEEREEAEQAHVDELLGALFTTVTNQSEVVKKQHSDRVNEMKSEWQLLSAHQEENYYNHIQTIEDNYRKFVQQSKEKAIATLKVL